MPNVVIYHNPRCSKSRQTLQLLRDHHIEPTIVEYLKTPPSTQELKGILKKLAIKPRDLIRKKESTYKEQGLDNPDLSDADLIQALTEHPVLIERPIVIAGNKAALGRPPENVLEIL